MAYHFQSENLKVDMQESISVGSSIKAGGDITAVAGQDGKHHDLTLTGSSIAAEGKVGLKASNDILVSNAENSLHYEMSYHKEGGAFSSSKSMHNNVDATQVVGSSISGGEGFPLNLRTTQQSLVQRLLPAKKRKRNIRQKRIFPFILVEILS